MALVRIPPKFVKTDRDKRNLVQLDPQRGSIVFNVDAVRHHGLLKYCSANVLYNESEPSMIFIQPCSGDYGDFYFTMSKGSVRVQCGPLFNLLPIEEGRYAIQKDRQDGLLRIDTQYGRVDK